MIINKPGATYRASVGAIAGTHPEEEPIQLLIAPSTSNEYNTAELRLIPIACWKIEDIRFAFDSSFVMPDLANELDVLAELREEHKQDDPVVGIKYPPLSVFGHADPVGNDDYNKLLSGRRAAVIYSLLISNGDPGTATRLWNRVATEEGWGADQRQTMQAVTGLDAGIPDSQLLLGYMRKLVPPELILTRADFLGRGLDGGGKADYQGCSRFNPLLVFSQQKEDEFDQAAADRNLLDVNARNAANAPNRRVMVLFFRPGSKVDPGRWPCPRATEGVERCIQRFWSNGQRRRSERLSDQDRRFEDSHDTFACRFYERLLSRSPCEHAPVPCPWCVLMSHVPPGAQTVIEEA
jgi:outer membrane protein OmpA-like peptidoglycan-associated protein